LFAQDEIQAVQLAWRAIALSERPEDQARRRAMVQRLGPLKVLDVGGLELFTWHIITTGIGNKIRAGLKRLTGVHPEHGRRFEPDAALLDRVSGYDRFLNQLTDGAGRIILDLRLEDVEPAHDPAQLALPISEPKRSDPPATSVPISASEGERAAPTNPQPKLTPAKLVADYITERVAGGLDYSGRGAIAERDHRNLHGQPGFGNKALTDLVTRARTNAGHKPNRGGHGSKG
jgi:hypothetical protein